MTEPAIDVHRLTKIFRGKTAVENIDLRMPRGQVWGFLGPNGSGKTTTIRMICGLLKPTSGTGTCLGYDIVREARLIKRQVGYMTQRFSFWGDLTVRENLEFVARLYGLAPRRKIVADTLANLGLTDRQHQLANTLSGGWKQRLALAAVTMHAPQLLLLDEPTAGVDPQARRDFWDEIHSLASNGMTVLVSTHYMDEAERCDRIVYLAHGRLIVQGTVTDIIRRTGLKTYRGRGDNARALVPQLKTMPGIEHVAFFGAAVHISSRDEAALQHAVTTLAADVHWEPVETSLEDTFIALMKASRDSRNRNA